MSPSGVDYKLVYFLPEMDVFSIIILSHQSLSATCCDTANIVAPSFHCSLEAVTSCLQC